MSKPKYYISTAIAYTSSRPHIGNTYEIVLADSIARYKRMEGYDVYFQTGTDEHGQKIEEKANAAGITPKEYVDNVAKIVKANWDVMNTSYDKFREYGKSLIAVAAKDKDSVWFTALYYQIPENYPAEKEKSVYLSTIMTRADDGWKLEWNDDVRSKLQAKYDEAGFTFDGLSAKEDGRAWAKFFIPFDLNNTEIFYEDAVMCKVTEMYILSLIHI